MALESTTCGIVHHARRTRAHCPTMVLSFKLSSGTVCLLGFSCRAGHIRKGKYKICGSYQVQDCTGRNGIVHHARRMGRDPPSRPSIRLWHKKFMETGTVFDTRRSGRPGTFEENIERVRQAFQYSPMKPIHTASRQLELPRSTVHRVSSILTSVVSQGLNI